jgi:hypothetical protein
MFLIGLMVPFKSVSAAMCSGFDCTGLFADSSCQATAGATAFYYASAYIEPRSSSVCKAQWTRVTNVATSSRWTAGSTRYGGVIYEMYHQSIQSGAAISSGLSVYTPMVGNDGGVGVIDTLGCGRVSTSSMTLPIGGSQPNLSSFCSGVW